MSVMEKNKRRVITKTFIAGVDKNVTLEELKTFLCNDDKVLERTLTLSLLLSKSGQSLGYAFVSIPITKIKKLFRKNESKLRGKTFTLLPSENVRLPKGSRWKTEEDGVYKATPPVLATYTNVANNNKPIPFCYNMIDCGSCILQDKKLDYCIEGIIDRAAKCGVEKIVLYSSSVEEARRAKRLSKLFPDLIYYTVECDPEKDFIVGGQILTVKEKKIFNDVAEDRNMKAFKIAFDLDTLNSFKKKKYDHFLNVLKYQIKWAIELKKPIIIENTGKYMYWSGYISLLPGYIDDLFKIFDSFNDKLPRIAITSEGLREEQLNRLVKRGYYVIITGYSWDTKVPVTFIRTWLWNVPDKYLCQILISSGSVYLSYDFLSTFYANRKKVMLCHPDEYYIFDSTSYTSLDLFLVYVDVPDVCKNQPIVMPCLVELVAANIFVKTPTELAKITKENAERFYCFEELPETSREWKKPLKKLKPCVSLLTTFQELPPCDKLFWIIFWIIVLLYIHVMFINLYCPEIYIFLIFTYICFYLVQCIVKRKH
ncbi:uncharacterized protein LOC126826806 [Patella vulgata]|uniref:uncharacterized protein LOC126826806 n=1 Tax=Patella vulgata TaxID=6465 RepID=UPI0021803081|nr:uncharacterized protein LOC126826806 [Patella vulgata]